MIEIQLNGETQSIPDQLSLAELITQLQLAGKRYAVEVNEQLIPKSQHADYRLQAGDKVEIVQAIGGG